MAKQARRRSTPPAGGRARAPRRPASAPAAKGAPRQASAPARGSSAREAQAAARRQAILDAALTVFAEHGYEAARLDEVAAMAGVAKGTLYLYFKDKQALFEALVRGAASPVMDKVGEAAAKPGMKAADVLDIFFATFQKEVLGTRRKLLLRLIIAEGPRFPAIAQFYHREVVSRGMALLRGLAEHAVATREFPGDAAARFPQLIVAPLLLSVIWDGLFSKIAPLDVDGLLRAHRELLTGRPRRAAS